MSVETWDGKEIAVISGNGLFVMEGGGSFPRSSDKTTRDPDLRLEFRFKGWYLGGSHRRPLP